MALSASVGGGGMAPSSRNNVGEQHSKVANAGLGKRLTWRARSAAVWRCLREKGCGVWIGPLTPGTLADVLIGPRKGPPGPRTVSKIMKWVPIVLCS